MSSCKITRLTEEEIPAFEALFVATLRELHSDNPAAFENYRSQYSAERLTTLLNDRKFCLLGMWQDKSLVGFGIGYVAGGVGLLHWMGIHPDHRKHRLGWQLGQRMVDELWLLGCHKLTLYTYAAVPWLIPFYEALGFYRIARIDNYYFHLDIVYMGNDRRIES